ncbi:hypothetical protein ACLKA7_010753 [Drosophila subpalustris]
MSMSSETTGVDESNSTNIAESSISNNSVEIKKLDTVLNSERSFKEEINDSHLNRLQNLRNELNYISDTDWMYESLEKKPQQ